VSDSGASSAFRLCLIHQTGFWAKAGIRARKDKLPPAIIAATPQPRIKAEKKTVAAMKAPDRTKHPEYLASAVIAAGLFVLTLWQLFEPDSMGWWAEEDGPFEYATAVVYGVSTVIFGIMAKRGDFPLNSARHLGRAILVIGALGCFFIMGEEISWGQRLIGFETPEAWADINYQDETTLHNLDWVYTNFTSSKTGIFRANLFNLMMVGFGVALPVIALMPWARSMIARLAIPIIPLRYALLFAGAWLYGKYLVSYADHFNTPPEVREFLFSIGILMFALTGLRRPWELYRVSAQDMSSASDFEPAEIVADLGS